MIRRAVLCAGVVVGVAAGQLAAVQRLDEFSRSVLEEVMPGVDSFALSDQGRPVLWAYRANLQGESALVGYVFLTSDFPPEQLGYSGPIVTLVGLDLNANVTGAWIVDYWESHRSSLGDFLRVPGVQEQFAEKNVGEAFQVGRDIDGISRATISVRALARGVRDAARRVAEEFLVEADVTSVVDDLEDLSWLELRRLGVVERMSVSDQLGAAEIIVVYLENPAFGEGMVGGDAIAMTDRAVQSRGGDDHVLAYAVNGSSLRYFNRDGWAVAQSGDTTSLASADVFSFGLASGGMLDREVGSAGAMIIPGAIGTTQPFTLLYQLRPDAPAVSLQYHTQAARQSRLTPAVTPVDEPPEPETSEPAALAPIVEPAAPETSEPAALAPVLEPVGPETVEPAAVAPVVVSDIPVVDSVADSTPVALTSEDTNTTQELVADTVSNDLTAKAEIPWTRVLFTLGLLGLATIAFLSKNHLVETVTLSVTFVFLGFVDGGFLSISHVTSAIWVGWSAVAGDISLLLLVLFTLVSTILVGRVFCGFLCPFGALQDFLTRLVPRRFQRTLSWDTHRLGLYGKYAVLAVIVISAVFVGRVSVFQYFEPFGTVFYRSPSLLLWAIAIGFLVASAIVPRFYCRYVCPLGAGLALLSVVSLNRIRRVEQCDHCKVCEQACPTGAIRGPDIDFKECVRCNICETKLIEKAGVCRHSTETVRERLVQIQGLRS